MPKAPSRRKTEKRGVEPPTISLPAPQEQGAAALTPMNFRVPQAFHREFKLYAVQHGMSMVDLLQESFRLMKDKRAE